MWCRAGHLVRRGDKPDRIEANATGQATEGAAHQEKLLRKVEKAKRVSDGLSCCAYYQGGE